MYETASQKKNERTIKEEGRELVKGGVNWRKMEGFIGRCDFFSFTQQNKNWRESFT